MSIVSYHMSIIVVITARIYTHSKIYLAIYYKANITTVLLYTLSIHYIPTKSLVRLSAITFQSDLYSVVNL